MNYYNPIYQNILANKFMLAIKTSQVGEARVPIPAKNKWDLTLKHFVTCWAQIQI